MILQRATVELILINLEGRDQIGRIGVVVMLKLIGKKQKLRKCIMRHINNDDVKLGKFYVESKFDVHPRIQSLASIMQCCWSSWRCVWLNSFVRMSSWKFTLCFNADFFWQSITWKILPRLKEITLRPSLFECWSTIKLYPARSEVCPVCSI